MATLSTVEPPGTRDRVAAALVELLAESGVAKATVREVAAKAGVAIGTVQYHFPTRAAMLAGAFAAVVERTKRRLAEVELVEDPLQNLGMVLRELLPLDAARTAEARVMVGFAAFAIHDPELARIQGEQLDEIRTELAEALRAAGVSTERRALSLARMCLAEVDGLALHEVSSRTPLGRRRLLATLDALIEGVAVEIVRP